MTTSTNSTCFNISGEIIPLTSSVYRREINLSRNNLKHIYSIFAYGQLDQNWDSYNANQPSGAAIVKANSFITHILSPRKLEVFYTAPTPDGNILIELKNESCNLEFIFSETVDDKVIASCGGELHAEHAMNETTIRSCLKWLYGKWTLLS